MLHCGSLIPGQQGVCRTEKSAINTPNQKNSIASTLSVFTAYSYRLKSKGCVSMHGTNSRWAVPTVSRCQPGAEGSPWSQTRSAVYACCHSPTAPCAPAVSPAISWGRARLSPQLALRRITKCNPNKLMGNYRLAASRFAPAGRHENKTGYSLSSVLNCVC